METTKIAQFPMRPQAPEPSAAEAVQILQAYSREAIAERHDAQLQLAGIVERYGAITVLNWLRNFADDGWGGGR